MSVEELRRLAIDAGKEQDRAVLSMIEAVALTGDKGLYESAKMMLQGLSAKQQARRDPFHPYPPTETIAGPMVIGNDVGSGAPVGLYPVELGQGTFIAGRSGSGKTDFFELIIPKFVELGGNVLVLDLKDSYTHLPKYLPECAVMTLGENCPINVLETTLKGLESIYRRTTGLYASGEFTFRACVSQLLDEFGSAHTGNCPSVADLFNFAQSLQYKSRSDEERDHKRMLKRLAVMAESLGEMARVRKGIQPEQLLSHNIVIRPGALPSDIMEFVVECIIYQCFTHRLERSQKMAWKNLIVLDEATTVFSAKKDRLEGQAYSEFVNLASKGREYGLQFLTGSQLPQYCSPAALGNSYVKLLLPCGHGDDYLVMARAMGLDQQQLAESHRLKQEPGDWQAVLKLSARWTRPMRIRLNPSKLDRMVTIEESRKLSRPVIERLSAGVTMGPPADLSMLKQSQLEENGPGQRKKIVSRVTQIVSNGSDDAATTAHKRPETILTDNEARLLIDINEKPLETDKERYARFEANCLRRTKDALESKGMITVVQCNDGTHGGKPRLPQLTELGASEIERLGHSVKAPRNWVCHRRLVARLEGQLNASGIEVLSKEFHEATGNITDLVIAVSGIKVALELQTDGSWQATYRHLDRLMPLYDKILLVASKGDLRKIKKGLFKKGLRKNLADDEQGRIEAKVVFCDLALADVELTLRSYSQQSGRK